MEKEELDIVDSKDEPVASAQREEAHKKLLRHRAIQVFVLNKAGKIFLQKRSKKKDVFPGKYECSVSGHVQKGETPEQAAVRELKEELGIEAKPEQLKELFQLKIEFPPEHEIVRQYILEGYDGQITLDPEEVERGGYITLDDLAKRINETEFDPIFLAGYDKWMKQKQQ